MLIEDRKYLIGLKVFATIALVCTLALWCGLWTASATPVEQSAVSSNVVAGIVDSKFDLSSKIAENVVTQNILLERCNTAIPYAAQSEQLKVTFLPSNTRDRDVVFELDDTSYASVDENGLITYSAWGWGTAKVYLKSNPAIFACIAIACYGQNPADTDVNTLTLPSSIKEGESVLAIVNDKKTSQNCAKYTSSDESVATVYQGRVYGLSEGTATITATFDCGKTASATVNVEQNPSFVMPQKIVFKDNISMEHNSGKEINELVASVEPKGAPKGFVVTSNDSSVTIDKGSITPLQPKTVTLKYTSIYNPNVSASVTIDVKKVKPVELRLAGADVITPNTEFAYSAKHMPYEYTKDIKWEVVSGKATISDKGVLVAKRYGTVVIRCTSTLDPSLAVEKTIRVKLFASTYEFARKLIGHVGLSSLLGFGIIGTLFLLCKRKWGCAVLSAPLAFSYAGVSEGIQYFTPGRVCSITDVFIDFMGALGGMAVAVTLVAIVFVVWRLANKKSFDRLVYAYKILNFGNLFGKTYKFDEEYRRENVKFEDENPLTSTSIEGEDK